jgi:transposase-like protein
MESPKTLIESVQYFSDAERCREFMVQVRWLDGAVKCPYCGSERVTWLAKAKVYRCYGKHAKVKFSLKTGTVFEDSPIGLEKWLPAAWMLSNCKNGISSYELSRAIGVTQKSAWFMLHRIRVAMKENHGMMTMGGNWGNPIEVDETFVGGKMKNMHRKRAMALREQVPIDRMDGFETNLKNKVPVMGMLDRQTRQVRAKVIPNVRRETLQNEILKNVGFNAHVFTDQHVGYDGLDKVKNFTHKTVNHLNEYVNGRVHTQGIENFWSLLKRSLTGTYIATEPYHLDRYVDEQVFRYNNRIKKTDYDRFRKLLSQIVGKRLTYNDLTGKVEASTF